MKNMLASLGLISLLAACAPAAGGTAGGSQAERPQEPLPLEDTVWELISFVDDGNAIAFDGQEYSLVFRDDGSLEARLHCNSGGGTYTADAGELTFGPLFTTLMYCGDDSIADLFGRALADVETYVIDGNELVLSTAGHGTLLFRGAESGAAEPVEGDESSLRGEPWHLLGLTRPGEDPTLPEGTYSVTFSAHADEVLVTADCNNGRATFSAGDDGQLDIGPVALTRMACPPGSISTEFAELLGQAGRFELDGSRLELITADSTVLIFGR